MLGRGKECWVAFFPSSLSANRGLARNVLTLFARPSETRLKAFLLFKHGILTCMLSTENWNMIIPSHTLLKKKCNFGISFFWHVRTRNAPQKLRTGEARSTAPFHRWQNWETQRSYMSCPFPQKSWLVIDIPGLQWASFKLLSYLTLSLRVPCHKGKCR